MNKEIQNGKADSHGFIYIIVPYIITIKKAILTT